MSQLALSVLVPNFNHGHYLSIALNAILEQSYQPLEIVVVDDASTDNSLEILNTFASRVRIIRNEMNRGVIANLNYLVSLAAGEYVYFAAADDKILPGFLERSMTLLGQHPEAGLCSTQSFLMDKDGLNHGVASNLLFTSKSYFSPDEVCYFLQQQGSWISGNATIYRKKALLAAGGFIPELGSLCDGFISEVIALRYGACFIREPLTMWRVSELGYAVRAAGDIDFELAMINCARRLMGTTYKDVFPSDYANIFVRRTLRRYSILSQARLLTSQQQFLHNLKHSLDATQPVIANRVVLWAIANLYQIAALIIKVYLGLHFGVPYDKVPPSLRGLFRRLHLLT